MRRFSISQLERFSGIKPHTIRVWELRYRLFSPLRSAGNTRYYGIDDLELLLYLSLLTQAGCRISTLRSYSPGYLKTLIPDLSGVEQKRLAELYELIICLYRCDVHQFELMLERSVLHHGIDYTIHRLIVPLLEKTAILSYQEGTAEIHFAVTSIRTKLMVAIDQLPASLAADRKSVLFLPEGEHYDLVLLYMHYCLKRQGNFIYYLGTNISNATLESVISTKMPDNLWTFGINSRKNGLTHVSHLLKERYPHLPLTIVLDELPLVTNPVHANAISLSNFTGSFTHPID